MTVNLAAHDRCPICLHILAKIARTKQKVEIDRLKNLLAKHRRRKYKCNSLIKSVKSCVLAFKNGIPTDGREVSDFYAAPVAMDLDA